MADTVPSVHGPTACVTITVPDMTARRDVRAVTAAIHDVPGVVAIEAHLSARQVRVEGHLVVADVRGAVTAAGYTVSDDPC